MARGYDQECPIARSLDVVGERWSLLVLRDLLRKGPLRFQDLENGLPGVAPNTLSARLKLLEGAGVIATRLYENHPPRFEYFLTDKGKALGPVLKALYRWGEQYRLRGAFRLASLRPPRTAIAAAAWFFCARPWNGGRDHLCGVAGGETGRLHEACCDVHCARAVAGLADDFHFLLPKLIGNPIPDGLSFFGVVDRHRWP